MGRYRGDTGRYRGEAFEGVLVLDEAHRAMNLYAPYISLGPDLPAICRLHLSLLYAAYISPSYIPPTSLPHICRLHLQAHRAKNLASSGGKGTKTGDMVLQPNPNPTPHPEGPKPNPSPNPSPSPNPDPNPT